MRPCEPIGVAIKVTDKPKEHPGFVDSEYREILPGDIVVVRENKTVHIGMITRFTPKSIDVQPVFTPVLGKLPNIIKSRPYYYDKPNAMGVQRMRGIVKIEEVI